MFASLSNFKIKVCYVVGYTGMFSFFPNGEPEFVYSTPQTATAWFYDLVLTQPVTVMHIYRSAHALGHASSL